jgi:succinoglycan biosynthesis transport protein ExoP
MMPARYPLSKNDRGGGGEPLDIGQVQTQLNYVPIAPEEPFWTNYWLVLRKRKWVVLATLVVVVTLATIVSLRTRPIYDAFAKIEINQPNSDALLGFKEVGAGVSPDYYSQDQFELATQVNILQSGTIALQVIKALNLESGTPDIDAGKAATGKPPDRSKEASQIARFQSFLRVVPLPDTRLVEIRYSSPDPQTAATVVNTLVQTFIEENIKAKFDSTMQASDWLSKQLGDLQLKVETSQEKILRYQKENGMLGVDEKQNIITSKLDELNREYTAAEADRIQKQSQYQQTISGNAELLEDSNKDSLIGKLRAQEADLKMQYAQLNSQFGDSYPKVIELKDQLRQLQDNIQAEVKKMSARAETQYKAALHHETLLRAAFEAQKEEANKLNEKAINYNILKRDYETNRKLYEELLEKLKQAGVSAGLKSSNIRVVDAARVPDSPASPNIPRNIELSLLLGTLGGIGLAFVLEALDTTVRTPEQVEIVSALPSLGIIPLSVNGAKPYLTGRSVPGMELISYRRPQSQIAESFRSLRTSILLSGSFDSRPKVLLITSALPREGKSSTSINLAIVLAQKGSGVLLVDGDMRRPTLHKVLGVSRDIGLSSILNNTSTPEDAIVAAPDFPNLSILPAGLSPSNPVEMLDSERLRELIKQWRNQYDFVIFDSPPALSVTDAVVLSPEVDAVIMVVRSGETTKDAVRRTRDTLYQVNARIMGIVMNAVDLRSPDLYYYYYYSKNGNGYYNDGSARN